MSKCVWIVNYYGLTPEKTSHHRHLGFAKYLQEAGYDVVNFSADYKLEDPLIPADEAYKEVQYGIYRYAHIKVPPYSGNGLKRMWSILQFAVRLLRFRKHFQKPDYILHNTHLPFDYPIFTLAKKLKAKYIAESWDLWPDDFVTFGLMKASNPMMKMAYALEKRCYTKADALVFSMEGCADYLRYRKLTLDQGGKVNLDKLHYINNTIDLKEFDYDKEHFIIDDPDLADPNHFKILYMGSVNKANNLFPLIQTAELLKDDPHFRFVIYGDGADRENLEQYIVNHKLENIVFKEKFVPYKYVAHLVSQSDLNFMCYAPKFGQYGVSSGKMLFYFAAGKPIVCNVALKYCEITRSQIGVAKDMTTPEQLRDAIMSIAQLPADEYQAMCKRARATAANYDLAYLSKKLVQIIDNL